MIYAIHPTVGLGPLRLGMARDDVRSILPEAPAEVRRESMVWPMDFFRAAALQVEYGRDRRCVSIQATGRATVTLDGRAITGARYDEVLQWFRQLDPGLRCDPSGFTSHLLQVGVYAPAAESDPAEPVEAVIVFVAGYYEVAV